MRSFIHVSPRLAALAIVLSLLPAFAAAQSPDEVRYYHSDAVGTVRVITDDTGTVQARYDYQPFGKRWPSSDPADARMFAGKERDSDTQLDYFGARYYIGEIGRFTSVDPVFTWQENLVDPQRWNRYAYAANNPFRYIDPDGRSVLASAWARDLAQLRRDYQQASGLTKAWLWARLAIEESSILPTPFAIASGGAEASILLGETMRRVTPVAQRLNFGTFGRLKTAASESQLMAANMDWLQKQIGSGARIFDTGVDAARQVGSNFYAAELKLLEKAGYTTRQFVKMIEVDGKTYRVFEWIKEPR